jgi:uncharacterized protein
MNTLKFENSPYLQQHKDNPVHWRAWSGEVLRDAKATHKPILVSIGYSTCHWCHVMAHESFEDPETARLMNSYYINVKIDREERPDLDQYFMNAVQAMGISGGWPLHCFLNGEGKPFYGGTYFPPQPKYGRPSWKHVLQSIHQAYNSKTTEINQQAEELALHLNALGNPPCNPTDNSFVENPEDMLIKLKPSFDTLNGGFGVQPKFPNTQSIQLLFQIYFLSGNREALTHALFSLRNMCLGGIYDHIEGGFSRYSVDANWNVPHFEKMLYDQAQLIQSFGVGYKLSRNTLFKRVIEDSLKFSESVLQDPSGLFYSALDADSEGDEGTFYVWTIEELKSILKTDYDAFLSKYQLSPLDQNHTDKKILRLISTLGDEALSDAEFRTHRKWIDALKIARDKRTAPSLDKKMIVSWNAMMVSAYVSWYFCYGAEEILHKAEKLMDDILKHSLLPDSSLCRFVFNGQTQGYGFIEDYAFVIKALLDLYSCTGNEKYIKKSGYFLEQAEQEFKTEDSPLFAFSSKKYSDFSYRQLDWSETIYPNSNALLSWSYQYLYEYYGDEKYLRSAKAIVDAISMQAIKYPVSMASWIQQILHIQTGGIVVKSNNIGDVKPMLMKHHLPGHIGIYKEIKDSGITICMDNTCFQAVETEKEFLSLFSGQNKFPVGT